MSYCPKSIIQFEYTNWKGETALRKVQPFSVTFGDAGPFHNHQHAWSLSAFCCDRGAMRTFLLADITPGTLEVIEEETFDAPLVAELRKLLKLANSGHL